jgi:hypothetical protein
MGDRVYRDTTNGHAVPKSWTVRIQLSGKDYLNLSREFETQAPPIVARFGDVIGQVLAAKPSGQLPLTHGPVTSGKPASHANAA